MAINLEVSSQNTDSMSRLWLVLDVERIGEVFGTDWKDVTIDVELQGVKHPVGFEKRLGELDSNLVDFAFLPQFTGAGDYFVARIVANAPGREELVVTDELIYWLPSDQEGEVRSRPTGEEWFARRETPSSGPCANAFCLSRRTR